MALFKEKKKGLLGGLFAAFSRVDEDFLDELEERLILADAGVETAEEAVDALRREKKLKGPEVQAKLVDILTEEMERAGAPELRLTTKPAVIIMVGVNGVGKTTTIGKLSKWFSQQGKKVLLCAADTFRAAAAEQLGIWAQRTGADIVRHGEGGDPGAVVFDACAAARARAAAQASNTTAPGSPPSPWRTISAPVRWAQMPSCSAAAARNVSAAHSSTFFPC